MLKRQESSSKTSSGTIAKVIKKKRVQEASTSRQSPEGGQTFQTNEPIDEERTITEPIPQVTSPQGPLDTQGTGDTERISETQEQGATEPLDNESSIPAPMIQETPIMPTQAGPSTSAQATVSTQARSSSSSQFLIAEQLLAILNKRDAERDRHEEERRKREAEEMERRRKHEENERKNAEEIARAEAEKKKKKKADKKQKKEVEKKK